MRMNLLRLEKDRTIEHNINKEVRNLFKPKKEIDGNIIKNIRKLFELLK